MRRPAALLLSAALALLVLPPARAQGVITAQPLPPPPGSAAPTRSPPPSAGSLARTVRPSGPGVPIVRPPHRPAKKPVAHKAAAKPAAKPAPAPAAAPAPVATPPKIDPTKGTTTGLKLPRWAAFRSDDVNLRTGPGTQYPIDWVYHRRDLPVRILREFEVWRLVQEQDGTKGWVHEATLTGRRGYVVQAGEQVLRASPDDAAAAVARVQPGVVGLIERCPAASGWCSVQAGGLHGWLRREALYGVEANEVLP